MVALRDKHGHILTFNRSHLPLKEAVQDAVQKLRDLSRIDLRKQDLSGINAKMALMLSADLTRASFKDADLYMAKLIFAQLVACDLRNAKLKRANMRKCNLNDADLRGANLSSANLEHAYLRNTDLRGVLFDLHTNLSGITYDDDTKMDDDLKQYLMAYMI